jgi:DNA-binding transcriptional LysR family regulator
MDRFSAMQLFVRVAEAGSFIAVAHQLDVDRSIVTRQVAGLEKSLGVKLINRSTRRLSLTTAGAAYLEKCRVILHMVESAESGLKKDSADLRGKIRLALPLSYGLNRLVPELLRFADAHPHIELSFDFSDRRVNLIEDGFDLAIRITASLQPGDVARKLGECRLVTVASADYLRRHGTPRHPTDLTQHACLVYANDVLKTTWTYRDGGQDVAVTVQGRLAANNGEALVRAAAHGMGITRQPDFIVQRDVQTQAVQTVLDRYESPPLGIYAILPSNRFIPLRVAAVMDFLSSHLQTASSVENAPGA